MLKHVPNALTILRIFLIPFIIICIVQENYFLAFLILTFSGLTDILDGVIARKYNLITNFGKLMDPLADKLTQISILVTLSFTSVIPTWIPLVVIGKEFIMISGASFLYGKEFVVSSKWYGKLATVTFYLAIVCSLFIKEFNLTWVFDTYLYYLGLVATFFSLFMYIKAFYLQGYLKKDNLKIQEEKE